MHRVTSSLLLRLVGPLDQLALCWQAGSTMIASVDFGEDSETHRHNVLVALQEMVTNVMRHAYGGDQSQPIEVEFTVDSRAFAIELRDHGKAFDPLAHDLTDLIEDTSMPQVCGGFGIYFSRLVMDAVTYERRGDCNVLRMEKLVAVPVAERRSRP